ncbi:MAG: RDD family protein [Acidimicrobiia bacterium]|nr:RDD family protein [Acidimicrobiia bacterium]MYL09984.1 RDD family protein [Acidimicrobiia bacterium]
MSDPAWESDPTTRHEYRWWDGERWADYVADNGVQSLDPLTGAENLKPPVSRTIPPAPIPSSTSDQSTLDSQRTQQLATRFARLAARFVDGIIFLAFFVALLFALHYLDVKPIPFNEMSDSDTTEEFFDHLQDYSEDLGGFSNWLWLTALAALYEIAFIAVKGRTPGKMATRIQVVRAEDLFRTEWGRPPSWGQSFARWGLPFVLGLPMYFVPVIGEVLYLLCYLSLTWDRDRQGWHDKAARTFVVEKL